MHSIVSTILLSSFSGLFVWNSPDNNAAGFCQFTDTRGAVSGDCFVRSIDTRSDHWLKETHIFVEGVRDGDRVTLRARGFLGTTATWGIATLNNSGFVLEASNASGVSRYEFTRSSANVANLRMSSIARRAEAGRAARMSEMKREEVAADYKDLVDRLPGVEEQILNARDDSVRAEGKLAAVKRRQIAIKDSIARERVSWKVGSLQTDLGFASTDENIARSDIRSATERIVEETSIARSMRTQITADSLYLVRTKR